MDALAFTAVSTVSSAGNGIEELTDALTTRRSGLRPNKFPLFGLNTFLGWVDGLEQHTLSSPLQSFACRNNSLADMALHADGFSESVAEARLRYGAHRIATLVGTSTSGILETELAYRKRDEKGLLPEAYSFVHTHELYSITEFVKNSLALTGPSFTVSTACSSSAKVFADAARLIASGFCDAAVVGGVDSLCLTTLYGFNSLELVASEPCRPFAVDRAGISIGEAAGFVLLERRDDARQTVGVGLLGYGESSDAYHMSTPHPEGRGAGLAMQKALEVANLDPGQIDYVNLHGTGTRSNDKSEAAAVCQVLGAHVPCSSTKGWTGHTLGAAGVTEAIISAITIREGFIPGTLNCDEKDPALGLNLMLDNNQQSPRVVLSNSFGFGGNNCSLILGSL